MRFATLVIDREEVTAVLADGARWLPLRELGADLPSGLLELIEWHAKADVLEEIRGRLAGGTAAERAVAAADASFAPPYRRPHKIWGIGLNYSDHARDLSESAPDEPASFIKGDHTIIGPGDPIVLPPQSERVTAEAELGVVIGRTGVDVPEGRALDYVFGFCAILDQTAEDILRRNPRFLTRSKNFPTFLSFGPELVTPDELLGGGRSLDDVVVSTWLNGAEARSNSIAYMTHSPARLISFHSAMMPLFAGDLISTGTPGAVALSDGDVVESRVDGLAPLVNPVRGLREGVGS